MRIAPLFVLVLFTACGGGGGGSAPPIDPAEANPAPEPPDPYAPVDIAGLWVVAQTTPFSEIAGDIVPLPVGTRLDIFSNPALGLVNVISPENVVQVTQREPLEDGLGFPVDWYINEVGPGYLDFGVGWDRLRIAGGGGQFADYYQHGIRLVALGPNSLFAFEALERQTFLGQPRHEWLVSHVLTREP